MTTRSNTRNGKWDIGEDSPLQNAQPPQSAYTAEANALGLVHWYASWFEAMDKDELLEQRVRSLHGAMEFFGETVVHRLFWTRFQYQRRGYVALNIYASKE